MREIQRGFTVWLTGLPCAGKTTIGRDLLARLRRAAINAVLLDGDAVRSALWPELGFSAPDRNENIRRIGHLCELFSANGVVAIVAAVSPFAAARQSVRSKLAGFIEVYVQCSLGTAISRDVKGHYKRALLGDIPHFTGISDPYEPPVNADVIANTDQETVEESTSRIWAVLVSKQLVEA